MMNAWPILLRELAVASRRAQTYWVRLMAAGIAIVAALMAVSLAEGGWMRPAQAGRLAFTVLAICGGLHAFFAGCSATADCLSEERREGTLGLLYLANLRSYDIVVGKLLARTWGSLAAILATAPVPVMTLLIGGVTGREVFELFLLLLNALFYAAAAGMFASACCRDAQRAVWIGLGLIAIPWICLPAAQALAHGSRALEEVSFGLAAVAGAPALSFASSVSAPLGPAHAGWITAAHAVTLAFSCLLLAGASVVLSVLWKDTGIEARWATRISGAAGSLLRFGRKRKSGAEWKGPFETETDWTASPALAGHSDLAVRVGVAWIVVLTAVAVAVFWKRPDWIGVAVAVSAVLLHLLRSLDLIQGAGRMFLHERHSGGLELVLTTPLTEEELVRGRMLELKRRAVRPLLWLLGYDVFAVAMLLLTIPGVRGWSAATCLALTIVSSLAGLYGGVWAGAWAGLAAPTVAKARGGIGGAFICTSVLIIYQQFFVVLLALKPGLPPEAAVAMCLVLTACSGLAGGMSAFIGRMRLLEQIREIAVVPTGVRAPKLPPKWLIRGPD